MRRHPRWRSSSTVEPKLVSDPFAEKLLRHENTRIGCLHAVASFEQGLWHLVEDEKVCGYRWRDPRREADAPATRGADRCTASPRPIAIGPADPASRGRPPTSGRRTVCGRLRAGALLLLIDGSCSRPDRSRLMVLVEEDEDRYVSIFLPSIHEPRHLVAFRSDRLRPFSQSDGSSADASIVARMSLIRSCRFIGSDGDASKP